MTIKYLMMAGGLLALVMGGVAFRFLRARASRITPDQLSGDWLAQARGREEHQP
jgi:hypothetical protein